MEFYSFSRRNEKYLWVVGFFVGFLILSSFSWHSIYLFLKKNPTLLFLSVTALMAYKSYVGQRHLAVAKNTIDFQTAFHNSKELNEASKLFVTNLSKLSTREVIELADRKNGQSENACAARELLNSWERVSVAVRNKVYDEEMLFNTYAGFLLKVWSDLSPYVKKRQELNPKLFIEVQWLALRWKVRNDGNRSSVKIRKIKKALAQLEKAMEE